MDAVRAPTGAFEGFQFAKEHDKGNEYNHRVLEAFFVEGQDIGQTDVLSTHPRPSEHLLVGAAIHNPLAGRYLR